jgi:hypothetical protein
MISIFVQKMQFLLINVSRLNFQKISNVQLKRAQSTHAKTERETRFDNLAVSSDNKVA